MFCDDSCVLTITLVFRKYGVLLVCFESSLQKQSENVVKAEKKSALILLSKPQILFEEQSFNNKIAQKFIHIQFDLRYRGGPKLSWHSHFSLDIEFSAASK